MEGDTRDRHHMALERLRQRVVLVGVRLVGLPLVWVDPVFFRNRSQFHPRFLRRVFLGFFFLLLGRVFGGALASSQFLLDLFLKSTYCSCLPNVSALISSLSRSSLTSIFSLITVSYF